MALNRNQRRVSKLPTDLYRAYSHSGRLLYVGISVNVFARLKQHEQHSAWVDEAELLAVKRYPNRRAAMAEEARAIRAEKPLFNITQESSRAKTEASMPIESFTLFREAHGWLIREEEPLGEG